MKTYKKNFDLLKKNNVYSEDMEHDACGVGLDCVNRRKKIKDWLLNMELKL